MRINKHDIPTVINATGAVARQVEGFGEAAEPMAGEYFSLAAGADIAPLLQGLPGDHCAAPHWGYLLQGVVVSYVDGSEETAVTGDLLLAARAQRPGRRRRRGHALQPHPLTPGRAGPHAREDGPPA